ncbi:hypothetical protein M378DRAFT_672335 [Amanita muscaria Koide BX008]|uniref:Uncharacterized protein n=1 Tax=Amanita muscaria (strain Koide BX008) TaxID=946122 RepID=A0A0C2X2R8_AMAMK|nr:hypothetical protein M378DRAFT_672335 [Amanita muscaria Koide BX008]
MARWDGRPPKTKLSTNKLEAGGHHALNLSFPTSVVYMLHDYASTTTTYQSLFFSSIILGPWWIPSQSIQILFSILAYMAFAVWPVCTIYLHHSLS